MNIAYITTYDARSLKGKNEWSGTGYYIAKSLQEKKVDINFIGPLNDPIHNRLERKLKRTYYSIIHQKNYQKDPDSGTLKSYAAEILRKLSGKKDEVVFSATVNPIAYLDCDQPIAFWADATFSGIAEFYPLYSNLHQNVVKDWHCMEKLALKKASLAIYSSDWAANSAIHDYGVNPDKVKVVPFGANIDYAPSYDSIKEIIKARPSDLCRLLFLGVDWVRKGGSKAYEVAKMLNDRGLPTELIVVGCQPEIEEPLPEFVKPLGFISKASDEGKQRIRELIAESHFLILPSLADCTPIVLSEANSLGTPCLSTSVGGIPTIIKSNVNGNLFQLNADIAEYCDYIDNLFTNYVDYKNLALSAFGEYQSRLNWNIAGQKAKELLRGVI